MRIRELSPSESGGAGEGMGGGGTAAGGRYFGVLFFFCCPLEWVGVAGACKAAPRRYRVPVTCAHRGRKKSKGGKAVTGAGAGEKGTQEGGTGGKYLYLCLIPAAPMEVLACGWKPREGRGKPARKKLSGGRQALVVERFKWTSILVQVTLAHWIQSCERARAGPLWIWVPGRSRSRRPGQGGIFCSKCWMIFSDGCDAKKPAEIRTTGPD